MNSAAPSVPSLAHAWDVLALFLIPVGGGIPAGVLLAKSHGMLWPVTTFLYFISDVILACIFEPLLLILIASSKKWPKLGRVGEIFKKSMQKTTSRYGTKTGPFALIMISLGVDPMTGRAAAAAAGHGFFSGWILAITGDLLYFGLIMASTLWLNGILGDGTWTTLIILGGMMIIPWLIRRFREQRAVKA